MVNSVCKYFHISIVCIDRIIFHTIDTIDWHIINQLLGKKQLEIINSPLLSLWVKIPLFINNIYQIIYIAWWGKWTLNKKNTVLSLWSQCWGKSEYQYHVVDDEWWNHFHLWSIDWFKHKNSEHSSIINLVFFGNVFQTFNPFSTIMEKTPWPQHELSKSHKGWSNHTYTYTQ